jgi:hypothetical protein
MAFASYPQFVFYFLEGVLKAASCFRWIDSTLIDVLGKPLPCIVANDLGRLATVAVESLLEDHVLSKRAEPPHCADVVRQLTAEIIVEMAPRETSQEVVAQDTELLCACEAPQCNAKPVFGIQVLEKIGLFTSDNGTQRLDRTECCKLAEVCSITCCQSKTVNRFNKATAKGGERDGAVYIKPELAQVVWEILPP